jgi:Ca-activated chloride channel family protein
MLVSSATASQDTRYDGDHGLRKLKRGQLLIAIVAAAAVALVAVLSTGGGDSPQEEGQQAPEGAVRVSFAFSPEKEKLLEPLIREFNGQDGRAFVEGEVVSSGDAETRIAEGRYEPVVWSPASSLWGRLLNFDADRALVPDEIPSIVRTPLVIAMWRPFAEALGWPRQQIGFDQIIELARSNQGFAEFGHPEFGRFKLVHTNPDFSTSGLEAVVAEYYAATGKREGLTEDDVSASKARRVVRDIERSIVHYGDTTLFIADQMRANGPGYASAVAMEEVTLLEFNRNRGSQPPLVALYPPEGTFYSDNPFIVLDAPWVSAAERAAAGRFQEFLAERIDPARAARSGFRPADLEQEPVAPVSSENGVDPAQPERVLGLPEPRVLDRIRRAWREDRKPASVLLVVDTSGSMNDEDRLARAKEGLDTFFEQVGRQDDLGLTIFSDQIQPLIPVGPFRQNEPEIRDTVRHLIADGGTAVWDATVQAFEEVRADADTSRINAVVVLTDGEDTDSSATIEDAVSAVRAQGDSDDQVRVFTIAYSAGAAGAAEGLEAIAKASGGQAYEGDTEDIESVYRSISSFF